MRDAIIELANPQIGPQGTSLGNTKCVFRSMESSIRAHASIPGPYQGRHDKTTFRNFRKTEKTQATFLPEHHPVFF